MCEAGTVRRLSFPFVVAGLIFGLLSTAGAIEPRLELDDDDNPETVVDHSTSRQWQHTPTLEAVSWETALQVCEGLELATHEDWHLPTTLELVSLYNEVGAEHTFFEGSFPPELPGNYWTSTSSPINPRHAYVVSFTSPAFSNELVSTQDKQSADDVFVICVRVVSGDSGSD